MANILKSIGRGALYVLAFPFGLLAIALYGVFGVFVFFFQFVRLIVLFFTGRNFKSDLPEDVEAKKIIEKNKPKEEPEADHSLEVYPQDSIVYGTGFTSPSFSKEKEEEQPDENLEEQEEDDNAL